MMTILLRGALEGSTRPSDDGKRPRAAQQDEEGQSEAAWRQWHAGLRGPGLIWGWESCGQLLSRVGHGQAHIPTRPSWLRLESVQRGVGRASWLGGSEDKRNLVVEAKEEDGVRVTCYRCGEGRHVGGKRAKRAR